MIEPVTAPMTAATMEPTGRQKAKPKIREVIVVEGKDDVSALRKAVDADILITTGLGLTDAKIEEIRVLAQRRGVIVFTDPDFPGGKIRHILKDKVPGNWQAGRGVRLACCYSAGFTRRPGRTAAV